MRRTAILLAGIGLLALLLATATGSRAQPADEVAERGRQLYLRSCASCHGVDPSGPAVYDTVPSLATVGGAAAVDLAVRTGRMPASTTEGPITRRAEPRFNAEDTRALALYVGREVGDTNIPLVDASRGDLQHGALLYMQTCAACHGASGAGSALGGANIAPSLQDVDPLDVAEAIQVGPGAMPVGGGLAGYGPQDVNSVARYVEEELSGGPGPGGLPIGGKGPVPEGFVAWVIGLGALVLGVRYITSRR